MEDSQRCTHCLSRRTANAFCKEAREEKTLACFHFLRNTSQKNPQEGESSTEGIGLSDLQLLVVNSIILIY